MSDSYITVIGSLNYDILMKQKRLPIIGETYVADSVSYEGGGKGANQAVQCAKLGVPTYLIGKVGKDNFGDILIDKLVEYGVKTDYVDRSNKDTGIGVVHVLEDGTVYPTIITGANYDIEIEDVNKLKDIIINSKIIILQMEIPIHVVEYIIAIAKEQDVYIILNAAPAKEINQDVLKKVDCLIVNEAEASFYSGEEIYDEQSARQFGHKLSQLTKGIVIITLGSKGSLLCANNEFAFIPAVIVQAIETTGAGDSYTGAFAYCKFKGINDIEACEFAAKVSAITVTKVGAQGAMPYLDELE